MKSKIGMSLHLSSCFRWSLQKQQTFQLPIRQGLLRSKYVRACGTLRYTPLCARVHNYIAFVLKSLILFYVLHHVVANEDTRYFYSFCATPKLLTTIAPIKLSDEYNNFKALVCALRDQAIEDHFIYFITRYNKTIFTAICRSKYNNLKRSTCLWNIRVI